MWKIWIALQTILWQYNSLSEEKRQAYGFDELLKKYDREIIESYEIEVVGNEIYITEQVNNILFCKW